MGLTYTPQNAIDFVKKHIKDIPLSSIDAEMCDAVSSQMYRAAFWRWTIQNIPSTSIPLVDGTQDYVVPTNLYRLWRARIVRTDVTPDKYSPPLDVVEFLEPDLNKCGPFGIGAVCHEESLGRFRLSQAVEITGSETYEFQGEYQVNPTKITDANKGVALWFPDQYFDVFCEGLRWKAFEYADDSRAGSVTIDKTGRRQATGQVAKFLFALDSMLGAEDFGNGNASEYPDEPFGVGSNSGLSSIYGA